MRNFTLFAAVLLLSVNFHAQAQPLATVHMSAKGGGRIVSGGMIVGAEDSMGISNHATLFNNGVWTPDMAGQSVFETAGAGLSYDNFISLLTRRSERAAWLALHAVPVHRRRQSHQDGSERLYNAPAGLG